MARDESKLTASLTGALVDRVAQIIDAYLQGNRVSAADVPVLVGNVQEALARLSSDTPATHELKPAVPIKKSVGDDFIICLEDGAKLTMLKRYLKTHHNITPEEYRRKWGLPHDYPMVAPAYARLRSTFAKKIGLGRIPIQRKRKK